MEIFIVVGGFYAIYLVVKAIITQTDYTKSKKKNYQD